MSTWFQQSQKTAHDQFQGRVILTNVGWIAPYTIPLPRRIQYEYVILRNEIYSSRAAKPPYQNMFYVLSFIIPHIPCKHFFYGFTTVKLKTGTITDRKTNKNYLQGFLHSHLEVNLNFLPHMIHHPLYMILPLQ